METGRFMEQPAVRQFSGRIGDSITLRLGESFPLNIYYKAWIWCEIHPDLWDLVAPISIDHQLSETL